MVSPVFQLKKLSFEISQLCVSRARISLDSFKKISTGLSQRFYIQNNFNLPFLQPKFLSMIRNTIKVKNVKTVASSS